MNEVSNVVGLDNGTYIGTLMPFRRVEGARPLDRERILQVKDQINRLIETAQWHFQTSPDKFDLGEPYLKLAEKIFHPRPEYSVDQIFKYWETHPINIDCQIIINLLLLFYLRESLLQSGTDLETMRASMLIDITCGMVKTGVQQLIGSIEDILVPLADLDAQREIVRNLGPGAYLYIRGPLGWFNYIYCRSAIESTINLNTIYQGENLLSIGESEFLAFSRDYYGVKLKAPQLVVKSFEYIIDELERNGRRELSKLSSEETPVTFRSIEAPEFTSKGRFQIAGIESLQRLGEL